MRIELLDRPAPGGTGAWRMARVLLASALVFVCLGAGGAAAEGDAAFRRPTLPPPEPEQPAPRVRMRDPLPAIGEELPVEQRPCSRIVKIEIRKWDHELRATCSEGHVRQFEVALGRRPFGDKQRQGDLRTPEGHYRVIEPPRPSQFHVFIPIDYPSVVDADLALSRGDIEPRAYLAIVRARLRDQLPPQDTALGGAIGIHGEGPEHQGDSASRDWTLGCIALGDGDARFIAERVQVGTPVVILP